MGRPTKNREYTLKYAMRISEWIESYIRRELISLNYPELVLSHCELLTYIKRKGPRTQMDLARAILAILWSTSCNIAIAPGRGRVPMGIHVALVRLARLRTNSPAPIS